MILGFYGFNEKVHIETEDMKTFKVNSSIDINQEMENFAVCLNSPWSQANMRYVIEVNCNDAYTKMDEADPVFRCFYEVVGYECITSRIYGYGNTEEEALKNCINNFNIIQKEFNKNNESF